MRMEKRMLFVSLVLILVVVASGGCIEFSPPGSNNSTSNNNGFQPHAKYISVGVGMSVNYTDIERINVSEVTPQLNAAGFVVIESELPPGFTLRNYTYDSRYNVTSLELQIDLSAYEQNNKTKSDFSIGYYPRNSSRDDESEKDNITTYIKTRANEVATICNLTLGWNKASWGWNYQT